MPCTWGRECKLGWGYNEFLERLIPVEVEASDIKSETWNLWKCSVRSSSSTNIRYWGSLSLLLEESCRKLLDFGIVFDDNRYWEINYYFYRPEQYFEGILNYPPNCTHFVNKIRYGVELWIQFPKVGFPDNHNEVENLFKEKNFTTTQKNVKCRVMINYNEIKETTLGGFMEFVTELFEGRHSQCDIPIEFYYEKLNHKIRETLISNEWEFAKFLSYLYCVYRKIEIKMERAGYPHILPDSDCEESLVNIRANLNTIKRNYKFVDKSDFLKLYPIVKKLFIHYILYIRYSIDHLINIDEGRYLPKTYEKNEPWLQKLNTWFPTKVNGRWINCIDSLTVIPSGYEEVMNTLRATTKFNHSQVISNDEAVEPYIEKENNEKILFGFVNMEGSETDHNSDNSVLLELVCPEGCTEDVRRWICTKCGNYLRIKVKPDGFQLLFCSCGSKVYDNKFFICHHLSHRLQSVENEQV